MRASALFSRSTGNFFVAVLIVLACEVCVRAQFPSEPQVDSAFETTTTLAEESSNPTANGSVFEGTRIADEHQEPEPPAFGGPIGERTKLTGDWLGHRSNLREQGVTLDVTSAQYYQGVAAGGQEQEFQYGGRNDYFLNVDTEKLGLWDGGAITLHGETRYGESVNTIGGTLAAPNLMLSFPLATGSVTALTGVTFTQDLSDQFQVFGGKLNTLDGFEQPLTGANNWSGFLNTAMLYNPVFARTVPYSTFGAGFAFFDDEKSFSVTAYDTNDTTTVTGFNTFFNNGVTIYAELNFATNFFELSGNQGISGTYSNGEYTNLQPTAYLDPIEGFTVGPIAKTGSWCLAYNFDQAFYAASDDSGRMWGVFGNFGIADANPSPVRWFAGTGISGTGGVAGRDADTFGCAFFYIGVSDPLKELAPRLLPLRDEYGVELYYNVAATPWCQITPDLQVISPFRERADTVFVLGLRAMVDF